MKRTQMFLPLLLSAYCGLIGCQAGGEDASESAQGGENISVGIVTATLAGLPTCTNKLAGTVAYVTSTSALYTCSSSQWREIACTTTNAGDVAYASNPQTLLACVAKKWTPIAVPPGTSSLVSQHAERPGAHCANGGVRIDTGLDKNGNKVLDANEIQQTSYVCNGTSGSAGIGGGTGGTSGGTGGTGGGTGGTGGGSDSSPCLTAGRDLVLIGDSYVNYIESLEPRLTQHAHTDGALSAGDHFDDHAVAGTSFTNTPLIQPQWTEAKAANPGIKFVVMDGGGMDVLLWHSECLADGVGNQNVAGCQQVMTDALAAANTLVSDMKASGVRDVVYDFYPHMPAGGHDILDWSFPMFKNMCEGKSSASFHCNMLDTRPIFNGHDDWFMVDGIHPLAPGMDAIGDAVWSMLTSQCITLPASGGCCAP